MNSNTNVESQAAPTTDPNQATALDALCNFYIRTTVTGLDDVPGRLIELDVLGYQVKINHLRYTPSSVDTMRAMRVTHYDPYLVPPHELRATFDMCVEAGQSTKENYVSSHGGHTTVKVTEPGTNNEFVGEATCSINDGFNKRKGILTALGRVFHAMCEKHGFTKAQVQEAIHQFSYMHEDTPHDNGSSGSTPSLVARLVS